MYSIFKNKLLCLKVYILFFIGLFFIIILFKDILFSQQYIYFTDFVIPSNLNQLNEYVSNYNVLNIKGDLRFNFFNELPSLIYLKIITIFFNYQVAIKILFSSLIVLIYIFIYIFTYLRTKSTSLSLSLGLFLSCNLWIVDRLQQGHMIYYSFFFIPAYLYLYTLYKSNLKRGDYIKMSLFFTLSCLSYFQYSIILIYITFIKFICDIIFSKNRFKILKNFILYGILNVLLLLPFIFLYIISFDYFKSLSESGTSQLIINYYAQTSNIFSLLYLVRQGLYSSTIVGQNIWFLSILFIPIIGGLIFLIDKKKSNLIIMLTLVIISFFSIGYWVNSDLYLRLYEIIPFFTAFRDMNKFIGFIIILIGILITQNYNKIIFKTPRLNYLFSIFLILVVITPWAINNKVFDSFSTTNKDFLYSYDKDNTIHNVISIPSYPNYFFSNNNYYFHAYIPIINSYSNVRGLFVPYPYQRDNKSLLSSDFFQKLYSARTEEEVKNILQYRNIKYIYLYKNIDLKSNESEIDIWYTNSNVKNLLNKNIIFENSELIIYKYEDIKPHIYSQNTEFRRINPTKYSIKSVNINDKQDLSFLESFDKQWNLYLKPIKSNSKDCNVIQEYNNEGKNIKECEHTQKFFEGEELSYIWKQPVFEDSHKLVYDYANQWTIDPEYIKANFDKSYYKENPDGSIDIELTLYFKPQSYFYLGIIISGTTLILCLGYLGYAFYQQIQKNSHNKK